MFPLGWFRLFLIATFIATVPAGAQTPRAPDTKVILTIDGTIAEGGSVDFTRTDLERMEQVRIRTATPWHEGVQTFEGVLLSDLMRQAGAGGQKVRVTALNKYVTEIPLDDFAAHGPILALKRDGRYMEIKDKGPLFIIYPFDERPELKTERYFGRAVWQVRTITVE